MMDSEMSFFIRSTISRVSAIQNLLDNQERPRHQPTSLKALPVHSQKPNLKDLCKYF